MLRHGQTVWNKEGRLQGRKNSTLTDLGLSQAKIQGRILKYAGCEGRGLPVVASPLNRAAETARIAAAWIDAKITHDPLLVEVDFGKWEGKTAADVASSTGTEVMAREITFDRYFDAPGGERYEQVADRIHEFLESLSGPTIIVTHGGTGRILRGIWLGLERNQIASLSAEQGCVYHLKAGVQTILSSAYLSDNLVKGLLD